jgi:ABC-type antimicrobial peptide transport system permease subunit
VRRPASPQRGYTCAGRAVRYRRYFNMFWLTIIVGVPVGMISVLTNHLIDFLKVSGGIAAFIGFCWVIERMLNMFGLHSKDQT